MNKSSQTQAMQVLHDMCIMAHADGGVTAPERDVLEQVAKGLDIPSAFICRTVDTEKDLD